MSKLTPTSNCSHTLWPPLPSPFNASVLSLIDGFESSQWLPLETIRQQQWIQIKELIHYFFEHSVFFKQRLLSEGLSPDNFNRFDDYLKLPLLTRFNVQEAGDSLFDSPTPDDHGSVHIGSTSGSTGTPVRIQRNVHTQVFHHANNLRFFLWNNASLANSFATVCGHRKGQYMYPQGGYSKHWSPQYPSGPALNLNTAYCTLDEQIDWLNRQQPTHLLTYPTNLAAIAKQLKNESSPLPFIQQFYTFSEAIFPSQRKLVQQVFNKPIFDMYSSAEVSMICMQCPDHTESPRYHEQSESIFIEIVDDNGLPVSIGEMGHILVTDLHNFSTPLLRYKIGDLGVWREPCECGRGLPTIERVLGRVRNMLKHRSGEKVFPDVASHRMSEITPVRQTQIIQTSFEEIEVKLVLKRSMNLAEEQELIEALKSSLGDNFSFTLNIVDNIPRSSGGKFEDFICQIKD